MLTIFFGGVFFAVWIGCPLVSGSWDMRESVCLVCFTECVPRGANDPAIGFWMGQKRSPLVFPLEVSEKSYD